MRNHQIENLVCERKTGSRVYGMIAAFSISFLLLTGFFSTVFAQIVEEQQKDFSDLTAASRSEQIDAVLAAPGTMFAITDTMHLITFNAATPGTVASDVAVTGLGGGEVLVGIDVRPSTGELYAFGLTDNGATRTGRLLKLDPTTGALTLVGAASFSTTLADTEFCGFDFNPVTDEIRVTNRLQQNLRVNPTTGGLIATDTNLSQPNLNDIAYDRNTSGASATTLFVYNFSTDTVARIGGIDGSPSPDGGVVTSIGPAGVSVADAAYFDIDNAGTARVAGGGKIYSVNLTTGALTLLGTIGAGPNLRGLTAAPPDVNFDGTNGADSITIVRSGANVVATGVAGGTVTKPLASLTQIDVNSLNGADTITIDFSGGGFGIPVNVNGGGPTTSPGDRLVTTGGNFATGSSNPINGHDGAVVYSGGTTGAAAINYTGLEPIDDVNVVANYTINGTNSLNFINIINGPVVLGNQTTQVNDGAVLFELVNFANKTNVTINALDGADQIAVNNNLEGVGLTSLTVSGGNGDDTFFVTGTSLLSGNTYALNGDADDDKYSFSGGAMGAPVSINGGTANVENAVTVFNAATANITLNGSTISSSLGSALTSVNVQRFELSNLNTLSVSGTAGPDFISLSKPGVATYRTVISGGPIFNFAAPAATVGGQFFANAAAGSDTLNIDNTGRMVNLRVAYNAGADVDTVGVFGNPGSPVARESLIAGATKDQGRLLLDPDGNLGFLKTSVATPNGDELDISYNGMESPSTDVPATIFDVCMSASADNASIAADGVLLNGAQSALIFSGSNTFVNTRFANKSTATFSGFTAADIITYGVTSTIPAGLTDVQFYGFLPPGLGVDDAPGSAVNGDFVSIAESSNAVRLPTFTYTNTPSVVDITGLPQTMKVGSAELLAYSGTVANNDVATVIDNTAAVNPATVSGLIPDGALYKRNGGVGSNGEVGPDLSFHGLGGVPFPLILDGNDPSVLPGDRLVYDGPVPSTITPGVPGAGDITAAGVIGLHYQNYEAVQKIQDTATVLTSSGSPTVFGTPVTFTATVLAAAPGVIPAGTVNFKDGANPIATCQNVALNGAGVATCSISSLSVGAHPMTAVYSGSVTLDPSTSNIFNQVVLKANTVTTITADTPDPTVFGQNYTVTATVTASAPGAGTPTGNIIVSDGSNACAIILPASSCVLPSTSAGLKSLTANYGGDVNFNNSTSAGVSHTINRAEVNIGVQTSINAPVYGQVLTMNVTLTAAAPGSGVPQSGSLTFFQDGVPINGCSNVAVVNGASFCGTNSISAGVNSPILVTYSGNANFSTGAGSTTVTIAKAPLKVTASSATVTYGDAAPAVTSTITGFLFGDSLASLTTQPTCSTTYIQGSSVAGSQYPTICAGGAAANYTFNFVNGTVTVNKKGLTVAADNKNRGYGAANPALTATLSGFVLGQNLGTSDVTGSPLLTTNATATSPVGSYTINAAIGTLASGNYSFPTFTNGTLSVTAAPLTVTADNQTRAFGAANPALTFQVAGFQNGEGPAVLTGTPNVSTTANAASTPGTYPISVTQGSLASPNYTFGFANGTLTVTIGSTTTTITNAAALGNATQIGQSYAVNWTVAPVAPAAGTPIGQVVVNDGVGAGSTFCTAPVSAGTCNLVSTTSGTKTITVTYGGDSNFTGSSATAGHNVINGLTGNVKQFIAFGTNTNLAGVTMTLVNTGTQQATTTTTDASGNYSFSTAIGQSYTITPSGLGKAFEAISRTYTNVSGNITGADFIAYDVPGPNAIPRSARVSSQIATQGQSVTLPVLITTTGVETRVTFSVEYPTGALGVPTVTCGSGAVNCNLTVNNSLAGKVGITVVPTAALAAGTRELVKLTFPTFANPATSAAIKFGDFPTARDVRNAENNPLPVLYWTDGLVSFTGGTLLDGATISGRVTIAAGQGLRNATVTLLDTAGGRKTTITSSFGNYQFENLEPGRDYMLVVTSKRYRFASRTVNLTENLSGVDLVGLE